MEQETKPFETFILGNEKVMEKLNVQANLNCLSKTKKKRSKNLRKEQVEARNPNYLGEMFKDDIYQNLTPKEKLKFLIEQKRCLSGVFR